MGKTTWNRETVARLKQGIADGLSAGQISHRFRKAFPEITRNAVIGKVYRLGLRWGKATHSSPPRAPKEPKAPKPPDRVLFTAMPRAPIVLRRTPTLPVRTPSPSPVGAPTGYEVTIVDLWDSTCHFPIGDPIKDWDNFRYCGAPVWRGFYCAHHHALFYEGAWHRKAKAHGERKWKAKTS